MIDYPYKSFTPFTSVSIADFGKVIFWGGGDVSSGM